MRRARGFSTSDARRVAYSVYFLAAAGLYVPRSRFQCDRRRLDWHGAFFFLPLLGCMCRVRGFITSVAASIGRVCFIFCLGRVLARAWRVSSRLCRASVRLWRVAPRLWRVSVSARLWRVFPRLWSLCAPLARLVVSRARLSASLARLSASLARLFARLARLALCRLPFPCNAIEIIDLGGTSTIKRSSPL